MNTTIIERTRKAVWTGRILSGFAALFLVFDATMKVLALPPAVQGTTQLGYPASTLLGIGLLQFICLVLYLVPRTALIGAILWTGYLGGAVATHVRVGSPLFTHILFPLYVAALLWAGLWLRDRRVDALLTQPLK
ncbi:MAG TPA: DoxX family protein [Bryobacteraceae bacterium]|nr:DoxX family protein [Bryobacteraceae bacterium]